jgi:alpha-amylase
VRQQCQCLDALNDLGFDGYRVDAMKHMPIEHLEAVFHTRQMTGKFVFGETLTFNDQEETRFLGPILKETSFPCYDFPLQETLRRAFSQTGSLRELVDPASCGQALPWYRAVTVSITHDIPNNDGFRGMIMPSHDEYLANVYLMGRDGGVPLVYSDNNQSAAKYPEDHNRWADAWMRQDVTAMVGFHNAVHGAPQRPLYEDDGFFCFSRGELGIVAINKTGYWQHAVICTNGVRQGRYQCQIHGYEMDVNSELFRLAIPPREAQMWLAAA